MVRFDLINELVGKLVKLRFPNKGIRMLSFSYPLLSIFTEDHQLSFDEK